MVLLGGDLFHDNKPSRKSMYQVMRTLRKNCLGMKPVELEFLSDPSEVFDGAFPHANWEDPDINISIPVFSIHGNHDDPAGDGHLCSLDLLQSAGLVNYFGRISEADNIEAKPVLLQKGQTKLALFGLSNVRDERMFRTFRDNKVKWYRPGTQQQNWFNLLTVHQNHHAHTATGYLPENILPDWMDLIVWGHEHECLIDPTRNPETGFHVMQPGSSVATSLVPGEAVPKQVAIVSVFGKEFKTQKIPLKTVRPFVTQEITLAADSRFSDLAHQPENRQELTRRLMGVVEDMIEEANTDWDSNHKSKDWADEQRPLPLVRLKVEYTAPEGGQFDCENPQRFSNRFINRVANINDVVYFYRKKTMGRGIVKAEDMDAEALAELGLEEIKVDSLVAEFLSAQSLKILPQAPFGEAVSKFVNKDDKNAMETFLADSLTDQQKQMLRLNLDEDLDGAMEQGRKLLEEQFMKGQLKKGKKRQVKERPDDWDSDYNGHWEDQPGVVTYTYDKTAPQSLNGLPTGTAGKISVHFDDEFDDLMDIDVSPALVAAKKSSTRSTRSTGTRATKKMSTKKTTSGKGRGRKVPPSELGDEEKGGERGEEEPDLFVSDEDDFAIHQSSKFRAAPTRSSASSSTKVTRKSAAGGSTTRPAPKAAIALAQGRGGRMQRNTRQSTLNFSQATKSQVVMEISDDEISEDDAFESMPATRSRKR